MKRCIKNADILLNSMLPNAVSFGRNGIFTALLLEYGENVSKYKSQKRIKINILA